MTHCLVNNHITGHLMFVLVSTEFTGDAHEYAVRIPVSSFAVSIRLNAEIKMYLICQQEHFNLYRKWSDFPSAFQR
jgi:hypothetical protein